MLPCFARHNLPDGGLHASEFRRKGCRSLAAGVSLSNREDLALGETGATMALSTRTPPSAFATTISVVVGYRAEEKMGWIDATSNVAAMQHPKSCRYLAEMQSPGDPVSELFDVLDRDLSIAVPVQGPNPRPATGGIAIEHGLPETRVFLVHA